MRALASAWLLWHIQGFPSSSCNRLGGVSFPMQIWPAIDLRGGKCVRLVQGDYRRELVFGEDPAAMARQLVGRRRRMPASGRSRRSPRRRSRRISTAFGRFSLRSSVPCELGGGIRDEAAIERLLDGGLARLVIGTKALADPGWLRRWPGDFAGRLVLGIDARDGRVATDGWLETSSMPATDLARQFADEPLAALDLYRHRERRDARGAESRRRCGKCARRSGCR